MAPIPQSGINDLLAGMNRRCQTYSYNSSEKANIGLQDLIPIPHSSHGVSFKDVEVCEAIQRDACPDHQASADEGQFLGH
ncbi:hypothetical protein TNCV_4653111 [Trichonephila clavipes]|nr:hypothetical protein TNCV_4653111 [Trichonephila clavipes]